MNPEMWEPFKPQLDADKLLDEPRKICVIFGGTGGIGKTISPILSQWYDVIQLGTKDVLPIMPHEVRNALDTKPEIVISLYGVSKDKPIHKMEYDDSTIHTMTQGHLNIFSSCLPYMRERGYGRIITVSSVLARKLVYGTGVYAANKAFIERITKQVAFENGSKGITANCLRLGYFDKGLINAVPENIQEEIKKEIPCGNFGDARQIAKMIHTIVESPYINGSIIEMDGCIS